jgi:hypothetical protein
VARGAVLVACLLLAGALGSRISPRVLADGSVYVAMADSLWSDGDLEYTPSDLARLRALAPQFSPAGVPLPAGLFLVRSGDEYRYGKPFLYSLVAAPWFAACGVQGFFVLNAVLLIVTIACGAAALPRSLALRARVAVSVLVATAGVLPAYVYWTDPMLLLSALVAAGVAAYRTGRPGLAGAFLACVASVRFPYALLLAGPIVTYAATGHRSQAARCAITGIAVLVGLGALGYVFTGQLSPYAGERYWYPNPAAVPFADDFDPQAAVYASGPTVIATGWAVPSARELAQAVVYFFAGRTTGIALYFPTFLMCGLWTRALSREKLLWSAAVAAVHLAFALIVPHNPVGGTHALGNRYFIVLPVAFLLLDPPLRSGWRIALSLLLLLPAPAALHHAESWSIAPGRAALAFPHRHLPFEWTFAASLPYPARYPMDCFILRCAATALTDAQVDPDGSAAFVRALPGRVTHLVFVRPAGVRPRVEVSPVDGAIGISEGGVEVTPAIGARGPLALDLSRPRAIYRDKSNAFAEIAVYDLRIDARAVPAGLATVQRDAGGMVVRFLR